MNIYEKLDALAARAKTDNELKEKLLATRDSDRPVSDFVRIAGMYGIDMSAIDLVMAGEEYYAAMRRSTNGGGENSPLLQGEDDMYEMFMIQLEG